MGRKSLALLFIITVLNAMYNKLLPLHPDEAYYWVWSRHLELSYFDHPPMIAYLIRLVTIFGQSEFTIRLVAVACMSLAMWLVYKLALDMFGERPAVIALLVMLFLPATQAGYLVVTPDAPLVLFWSLTLYCLYKAIWDGKRGFFYLAGLSAGCLLLSKYTGVLLLASVFAFLLFSKRRSLLREKEIYFALIIAAIVFTPVLVWNAQHDWISFRFQLTHGMGGPRSPKLGNIGDFLAGQALTAGPIFLIAMLYYILRYAKTNTSDDKLAFLFWPFACTFAFFMYGGLFKHSEANWAVPAYISGVVILAYWLDRLGRKCIIYAGIGLTIVMVVLVKFPEIVPNLPSNLVMKRQFMGYQQIFEQSRRHIMADTVVLSDSYQNASEAWYYLQREKPVYVLSPSRFSMYDIWSRDLAKNPPPEAIYLGKDENAPGLRKFYADVQLIDVVNYRSKYVTRRISVYRCLSPRTGKWANGG